nr:unnamed protein product [Callosobruchus chinensis]
MAYAVAKEKNIDIIIVSEPNKALVQNVQWITDTRLDVAVYFRNPSIEVSGITKKAGYICIKLRDHNLYCGYSSPNIPLSAFKQYCDQIMEDVQSSSRKAILLGDLNVKSPEWGSPITDDRGAYLMEWISALDLVVHNTGDEPTFVRGESTSFIDITCSTASAACDITEWRVLQEETMSDHQFIYFEVRDRAERKRYNEKRLVSIDVGKLRSKIKQLVDDIDGVELTVQKVTSLLKEAYSYSTPTKNSRPLNNTPYWWNDQIKAQREECSLARRKLVREGRRCHSEEDRMQLRERYKSCKRELARLIGQSKKKIWQEVCLELEADIWGAGYKIVTGYMNATPKLGLTEDTKVEIVDALFPVREECWIKQPAINDVEMFTEAEIFQAGESIKCRKAPGPDGIPPEVVKELITTAHSPLLRLLNSLLARQEEKLNRYSDNKIGEFQGGFRKGRSTIDQIATLQQIQSSSYEQNLPMHMLFIDYKQAYDSIDRNKIYSALVIATTPECSSIAADQ